MKEGDKVLCIKDVYFNTRGSSELINNADWFYTITNVFNYDKTDKSGEASLISVKCNLGCSMKFVNYGITFKKYFITEKEQRKLKLEKLNESR